jgi:hypothetical protein
MLTFANANEPAENTVIRYSVYARTIDIYSISFTAIEKQLAKQRRGDARGKADEVLSPESVEVYEGVAEDKAHNLLDIVSAAITQYVNARDRVTTGNNPFSNYEFFYDLIPTNGGACDCVVIASESLQQEIEGLRKESVDKRKAGDKLFAADYSRKWERTKEPMKPMMGFWHKDDRGQWALVESIKNPCFNERFHAFVQGTSYFFVTDSGRVYVAKKPETGERKIEEVWLDKKRPINGAITDTASGKTFLFGAASNDSPKMFYFELTEKPQPVEFERKALVDKKLLPPLDIPVAYAHVLLAEKKIKLETKPEPKP